MMAFLSPAATLAPSTLLPLPLTAQTRRPPICSGGPSGRSATRATLPSGRSAIRDTLSEGTAEFQPGSLGRRICREESDLRAAGARGVMPAAGVAGRRIPPDERRVHLPVSRDEAEVLDFLLDHLFVSAFLVCGH